MGYTCTPHDIRRLNKAANTSVIPCPLCRNFIVPAVNAESTWPIQCNSLTRTASSRVKCTSAQTGSLIVLVTRLFMCDKRFRHGPLSSALELPRCSHIRNILFRPIEELLSLYRPSLLDGVSVCNSLFFVFFASLQFVFASFPSSDG